MDNYITLKQLRKTAESLLIKINENKDHCDNARPKLEPMANVEAMLTSYGLNASANLQSAAAGTAEIGKAVVQ